MSGLERGSQRRSQLTRALACAIGLMVAVFCLSVTRLEYSRSAITVNNCVFGADTATYAKALAQQRYGGLKPRKHPLAVVLIGGLARPLIALGLPAGTAGSVALALIQAAGAGLLFAFLRHRYLGSGGAAFLAALALSAFGTVTIFGVIETYGVTFMAIALACLAFALLAPRVERAPLPAAIGAGTAGAIVALTNPPALAFLAIYTGLAWRRAPGGWFRRFWLTLLLPAAIASAGAIVPAMLFDPTGGLVWQGHYLRRYADLSNFADARIRTDYLASFFLFAFVAPLDHVQCRYPATDIAALLGDPMRAAALVGIYAVGLTGIVRGLAGTARPVVIAALGTVAALFLFYLFFNPDEALLYSSQWTLALLIAAAPGLASRGRGNLAIAGAVALSLGINVSPLHNRATGDPRMCCPSPPATMLEREQPLRQSLVGSRSVSAQRPNCVAADGGRAR